MNTTIKVDSRTRDALRSVLLDGETLDAGLRRLVRNERRQRMAQQMANYVPTPDESMILDGGRVNVGRILKDIESRQA